MSGTEREEYEEYEEYEERAAILEYHGGYSRAEAESLARQMVEGTLRDPIVPSLKGRQ